MSTPFYVNISKLFNIEPIPLTCIGTGLKNNRCRRRISANNCAVAVTMLHSLERLESINDFCNQLRFLASNLLCQQHCHQRKTLSERWWLTLLALSSTKSPKSELKMPGSFPEDDENLVAAILELSRVNSNTQRREEDAQAKEERAKAKRAEVRAKEAKAKAEAQRTAGAGISRQQGYQEWMENSKKARESLDDVPFPDPPSYGCCDVACRAFQKEKKIEWCEHDLDRLLLCGNIRWDQRELRRLRIIWHPDRFVSRPSWQSKAEILFQMIPSR